MKIYKRLNSSFYERALFNIHMKKFNLFYTFVLVAIISLSCSDNYTSIDNGVYFDGAKKLSGKQIIIDDHGGNTYLRVKLANKAKSLITLHLVTDENVLKEYNAKNGTDYKTLPTDFCTFDKTLTIDAGKVESSQIDIKIKPLTDELKNSGLKYAVPIRIDRTENGINPVGDEAKYVILIDQIMVTKAFVLNSNQNLMLKLKDSELAESLIMPSFTIELWICPNDKGHPLFMSGYPEADTNEVWFTLFNWGTNDQPGVKMRNTYFNTGVRLQFKKWYHIALSYNGVTGNAKIYINGKERVTRSVSSGNFLFKPWVYCCGGNNSWCGVREYRIWNIERSQAQIENNMQSVDPSSQGLQGYWKMNEGIGNTFKDCSGNSKEGVVVKNGVVDTKSEWVEYRSDHEDIIGK